MKLLPHNRTPIVWHELRATRTQIRTRVPAQFNNWMMCQSNTEDGCFYTVEHPKIIPAAGEQDRAEEESKSPVLGPVGREGEAELKTDARRRGVEMQSQHLTLSSFLSNNYL